MEGTNLDAFTNKLNECDFDILYDCVCELLDELEPCHNNALVSRVRRKYYDKIKRIAPCNHDLCGDELMVVGRI